MQAFFDAFGRLKQIVIMRLMSTPKGIAVPPNVLVESVVPQQAILAHGKTVAFFTQGGANSVIESIYHRYRYKITQVQYLQGESYSYLSETWVGLGLPVFGSFCPVAYCQIPTEHLKNAT